MSNPISEVQAPLYGYQSKHLTGQVATLLKVSESTVKKSVKELGLDVEKALCGTVERHVFYSKDVFELAVRRRERQAKDSSKTLRSVMFYNEKGGVGKTTLAREVACIFQLKGYRTLLIDSDGQNHLTNSMGYDADIDEEIAEEYGFDRSGIIRYHLGHLLDLGDPFVKGKPASMDDVVKMPFGPFGPHLIPANESLNNAIYGIDKDPYGINSIKNMLRKGLKPQTDLLNLSEYDLVIFDCNPSRNRLVDAIFHATDFLIIPMVLESLSLKGVNLALDKREDLISKGYEEVPFPLIVGNQNKSKNTRCAKNVHKLQEMYPQNFLNTLLREAEEMRALLEDDIRVPLCLAKPSSKLVNDYYELADELEPIFFPNTSKK